MALYVDLAQVGIGEGTEGDPYNFTQFYSNPGIDDFKLKNSITLDDDDVYNIQLVGNTISNWLPNEPWRIHTTGGTGGQAFNIEGGTVKNGIWSKIGFSSGSGHFYNSFIYGSSLLFANNIYGCVILGNVELKESSGVCQDTILNSINADRGTFKNCVFVDDSSLPTDLIDCQAPWSPPPWPASDAPKEDFDAALLSVGINTPPQPGNPPYTGYNLGLWGNPRTGIGALYFLPTLLSTNNITADGGLNILTISTSYLLTKITDSNFSDPNDWKKVTVTMKPEVGDQFQVMTFRPRDGEFVVKTSFAESSYIGTWTMQDVYVVTEAGGVLKIDDSEFDSTDNLTVTAP